MNRWSMVFLYIFMPVFLCVSPLIYAQHLDRKQAEEAIQTAARVADITSSNEVLDREAMDSFLLSFDLGGPADALQRFFMFLYNFQGNQEIAYVSAQKICSFLETLNQSDPFKRSASWNMFLKKNKSLFEELLYQKKGSKERGCGNGLIREVKISGSGSRKEVEISTFGDFNLENPITKFDHSLNGGEKFRCPEERSGKNCRRYKFSIDNSISSAKEFLESKSVKKILEMSDGAAKDKETDKHENNVSLSDLATNKSNLEERVMNASSADQVIAMRMHSVYELGGGMLNMRSDEALKLRLKNGEVQNSFVLSFNRGTSLRVTLPPISGKQSADAFLKGDEGSSGKRHSVIVQEAALMSSGGQAVATEVVRLTGGLTGVMGALFVGDLALPPKSGPSQFDQSN